MKIALINTNRMKPPIAPIGLDYVAETLASADQIVEILDLCWEENFHDAIRNFFKDQSFDLIGITLRNTDDCAFTTRQSFLTEFSQMVAAIRDETEAPIIVGGVGFSIMPKIVLDLCHVDAGFWGDGEFSMVSLARHLEEQKEWKDMPNLIWKNGDTWIQNPIKFYALENLPSMTREWIDNQRYFSEGGQAGFETKRGCPRLCIYCADPVAKGNEVRPKIPFSVGEEIENLLKLGLDYLHTCDCEFNIPEWHAKEICREIIRRNLGNKIQWYAYCSPQPFSKELAYLMKKAGCIGINFGVDHGDDSMLKRLKRFYTSKDILHTVKLCKDIGITVMLDLLFGAPGESKETLKQGIETIKKSEADRIGIALGVRIYPGTELEHIVRKVEFHQGLTGGKDPAEPLFFLEPGITRLAPKLLDKHIGDDNRFLFFNPDNPNKNYNYNNNESLIKAIQEGYRGAYWDILRKIEVGEK